MRELGLPLTTENPSKQTSIPEDEREGVEDEKMPADI
jgi:hypothetical protein